MAIDRGAAPDDGSAIRRFRGEWRFLSNFWPSTVVVDGLEYPTVEHGYQATKCARARDRERIRQTEKPGDAKQLGSRVLLVEGWDDRRDAVMLELLRQKFRDPELRARLVRTGTCSLVEENDWGDTYWGVSGGTGENRLGELLETVRAECRAT